MQTILVTGGAGFIGSNFVRHLLSQSGDRTVVNMDSLTYAGNLENLKDLEDNRSHIFVRGDIRDAADVARVFDAYPIDVVVNFAAESHVDRSILNPNAFAETNYMGVCTLLAAARAKQVKLFVQVSTDEVYGSLGDDGRFTESSQIQPNSPYAASKAAADLMVRAYCKTYGFPAIITRCCNNYGPYQFPEKLIPLIISNALADMPIPVYGDGKNVRDWIHVIDHARAIEGVMEKGRPGEVYNVGTECEVRNIDLVEKILDILGKPRTLITYVADRPGHDRRYAIDPSKISRELGFASAVPFDKGLSDTVSWYLDNRQWWQRVKDGSYMRYYDEWYKGALGLGIRP